MLKILKNKVLTGAFITALAVFGFLAINNNAEAATCTMTTGTWDGVAGASGTGTSTFSSCTGGGTNRPAVGDVIQIPTAVTLTITGSATVAGIIIDSPAGANGLTINTGVTVTNSGSLSFTANATANAQTLTIAGTGILNNATTGVVNAPTGAGNSLVTCSGTGTLSFGSTLTITGNSTSTGKSSFGMGTCTLSAAGITLAGGSNATGVAEITASTGAITTTAGLTFSSTPANATLVTSGAATITNTGTISGAGVLSLTAGTLLRLVGTSALNTAQTTWKNWEVVSGTTTLGATATITGLQVDSGATLDGSTFLLTSTCASTGVNGYTINGTFAGTGGSALTTAGCTIDGTGTVSNTGTRTWTNAKTIASTAGITFAGTTALATGTTVTNNGTVTHTGVTGITGTDGTSVWTQGANSTLNFAGGTTTLLSTGVLNASNTGNTVSYNLAGAQTVKVPASSYYNLSLQGSGTKTIGSGLTVGYDIVIDSGVVAALTGTTAASGGLRLGGSWKSVSSYGFTGSGATVIDTTFFNSAAGLITNALSHSGGSTTTTGGGGGTTTVTTIVPPPVTPLVPVVIAGCGNSNTGFSITTGQSCATNTVVQATVIAGCSGNTGFSTTTGVSCAGNTAITPPGPAMPSHDYDDMGTVNMKVGSKGMYVSNLQLWLNAHMNAGLVADGAFGPKTAAKVKVWQASVGLSADGVVGPNSRAKMALNANIY